MSRDRTEPEGCDDRGAPTSAGRPILCVVGARPNYMKMAPIIRALAALGDAVPPILVHTGQHYDAAMNDSFFTALGMPRPAVNLEVGSASHAVQTAEIMKRFEPVLDTYNACGGAGRRRRQLDDRVRAGRDQEGRAGRARRGRACAATTAAMPEEINRVLTDQIADLLYTTERSAAVEPAGRGHRRRTHRVRRQRDDRHAARPT